jgi:hypothetical protein
MIEVLKQALEALENGIDGQTSIEMDEAITAIKEAIREHAMFEVQRLGQEIEQEPVAWMHIMDNTEGIKANGAGIVSITQKRKHPFGKAGIDFSKSYPVTSTPLYTHPPQRKPLTDEQILANETLRYHFGLNGGAGPVSKKGKAVIDAIEAAHGIKE